ncbi:acidic leucine-rich nuclear phosphoprotein 32 family member B-like [Gossypium australe]|uniref:Acidic leucine-rich nuclear phosphoprotein 32 family member B-like n=1 Tax=Gossypium australe TaxID=47621 RepID=A0A5B6WS58_9ROSI|nr:acidic leucine-rich nuclear phosphoprotein 32 family member B-like [Gossypium australe]
MQLMRNEVKQVQSERTNTTKTLTKLEDQMNQLMSMMGDIKRKIGTGISGNTENNPRGEGKEHVKVIALHLGEILKKVTKPVDEPKEKLMGESALTREEFVSFLNLFKSLNVNLPLLDLIEKVLKCAKYLKEIMSKCRKIKTEEQAA